MADPPDRITASYPADWQRTAMLVWCNLANEQGFRTEWRVWTTGPYESGAAAGEVEVYSEDQGNQIGRYQLIVTSRDPDTRVVTAEKIE